MVPWVGLHCVIVVFPDHTHLLLALEALFLLKLIEARKLTYNEKMHKYLSFFLIFYILPDPILSIIGRCTLYTPGCRMKAYK